MPNKITTKRQPIFVIGPSIAYIPLTNGQFALVEAEDAAELCQWNWYAARLTGGRRYTARRATKSSEQKMLPMHQQLLPAVDGHIVDHKNLNSLDNRKNGNLRSATIGQNNCNQRKRVSSKNPYKGVHPHRRGMWKANIKIKKKLVHLGCFPTAEAAHAAYCAAAAEHHGEFARFA